MPSVDPLERYRSLCPVFDERRMGDPVYQYVCWVDVMGSKSSMRRQLSLAANFVMKLHVAALEVLRTTAGVMLYPVMDGLYVCASRQGPMLNFLKELFFRLGVTFALENNPSYRFCVRAGLAFGPVITKGVTRGSPILSQNQEYCKSILLGITVSQAYTAARHAAPFGIRLHESVRAFAPKPSEVLSGTHYKWWKQRTDGSLLIDRLKTDLVEYHKWCDDHSASLLYKKDRIQVHSELVKDYFTE
jgi:hypothetical protein